MMYLRAISPILHLKVFSIYCVYVSFWIQYSDWSEIDTYMYVCLKFFSTYCVYVSFWIQYSDWSVIDTYMYVCLKFFSTYCVYVSFWIQYYDLSRFKTQLYIPRHFYHYFQTQFSSIFFYLYLTLSDIIYFFCIFYVDEMFLTQYQNVLCPIFHYSDFRLKINTDFNLCLSLYYSYVRIYERFVQILENILFKYLSI